MVVLIHIRHIFICIHLPRFLFIISFQYIVDDCPVASLFLLLFNMEGRRLAGACPSVRLAESRAVSVSKQTPCGAIIMCIYTYKKERRRRRRKNNKMTTSSQALGTQTVPFSCYPPPIFLYILRYMHLFFFFWMSILMRFNLLLFTTEGQKGLYIYSLYWALLCVGAARVRE